MDAYQGTYDIRWSDIDANGHVNYAAYIDAAGDLRFRFFMQHGYPPEKFAILGMGPIYTSMQAQFLREVLMGETVTITYALAGLSSFGGRWRVHHDVLKANGKRAVSIDLEGALLDLRTRKLTLPTADLQRVFNLIPRTAEFEAMPDSIRPH